MIKQLFDKVLITSSSDGNFFLKLVLKVR